MSLLMIFMPESPIQIAAQFDLNEQTIDRARSELKRLRSPDSAIESELSQIVNTQKALNEAGNESLSQKVNNVDFYKPLIFALVLMLIQQMSGTLCFI